LPVKLSRIGERKLLRRIVSGIMLTLLLISMLTLAFNIQPAKASGTIYIRADGAIDPPTAPISSIDNITYSFTSNIYDSIVVERNDIVLDGAAYTIQGTGSGYGFTLSGINNVSIKNANIERFYYGILLSESSTNSISGNNITANYYYGIGLYYSSNNSISGNNITNNNRYGIWFQTSSNNTFRSNSMVNNTYNFFVVGVSLSDFVDDVDVSNTVNGKPVYYWINERDKAVPPDSGYVALIDCTNITVENLTLKNNGQGVLLAFTTHSTIAKNTIANNERGVWLCSSSNNSICGNNITNNSWGVWLSCSSNYNSIYHNNFIGNTKQVQNYDSMNTWDDGYPSGGNYWSDYSGVDLYSGPYQNETGSDGIGDTPYVIDENNRDNYPLMKPYPWDSHDIGITYIGKVWSLEPLEIILIYPPKTIVGIGFAWHINIFVMNYGTHPEVFNATFYANTTIINTLTNIALPSRKSIILNFTWDTTGFAKGNYTIWAYAWPVQGEVDTTDNTYSNGWVLVTIAGDVDGSRRVEMLDMWLIQKHYGARPGQLLYDANCDVDDSGRIEMTDMWITQKHYGEHW
jgi:parallel beta-helix repeat protein